MMNHSCFTLSKRDLLLYATFNIFDPMYYRFLVPNYCSITGCGSNYRGEPYSPVFKLLSARHDLRIQWLNALRRDNIVT